MSTTKPRSSLGNLWPIVLGIVLVAGFFLAHQAWSTGFFTADFGTTGTFLLYTVLLTALVAPILGIVRFSRRRELLVLLLTASYWTVASIWFFLVFPFNFSNLTLVMPGQVRFLLGWISNDIGRLIVAIGLIGAAAFIPFYALQLYTGKSGAIVRS